MVKGSNLPFSLYKNQYIPPQEHFFLKRNSGVSALAKKLLAKMDPGHPVIYQVKCWAWPYKKQTIFTLFHFFSSILSLHFIHLFLRIWLQNTNGAQHSLALPANGHNIKSRSTRTLNNHQNGINEDAKVDNLWNNYTCFNSSMLLFRFLSKKWELFMWIIWEIKLSMYFVA